MLVYIPIAVYRLPGDKYWTADALGLMGAVTDGKTPAKARKNLETALGHYIDLLLLSPNDDPLLAAEAEYVNMLTAPPEGVDWIAIDLSPAAKAARAKFAVPVKPKANKKTAGKTRPARRTASRLPKASASSATPR